MGKKTNAFEAVPQLLLGYAPDSKDGGYDVIVIKKGGNWETYICGDKRFLSDSEVEELVKNKIFTPLWLES